MKRTISLRLISALLIFILTFSLVSCEKNAKKTDYNPNYRLEVIKEEITYSESFIENIRDRFVNLSALLVEEYQEITLNAQQKQEISESFTKTVLPIIYRIRIYEDELDAVLSALEQALSKNGDISPFNLYETLLYNLGSKRSGILLFEISLMIIGDKEKTARERYEQYGYQRYLDEAEKQSALKSALGKMGEERFTDAFFATSFIFSTLFNLNEKTEENAFLLEDAELLFLLERQSEIFTENCPLDSEWQTIGKLIDELIPINSSNLNYATLYALKNDGYFARLARVMPSVISLYASLTENLKGDGLFSLEAESSENREALILTLVKSENEIRNLDSMLSQYAKVNSDRVKNAVESNTDRQKLQEFLDSYSAIDCEALISALKEEESPDANELLISYLYGFSPYIAYVLFR